MVDFYRARTPLSRHGSLTRPPSSISPSPTPPRRGQSRLASSGLGPRTPSRSYQVYNDALPHSSQPQTPANLPEAEHQSRFHPSYTAPVRRAALRADRINSRDREGPSLDRAQQLSTPLRQPAGRFASPIGTSRDGFAGLYGGRENGDEESNCKLFGESTLSDSGHFIMFSATLAQSFAKDTRIEQSLTHLSPRG
jgi:hypothetical protein